LAPKESKPAAKLDSGEEPVDPEAQAAENEAEENALDAQEEVKSEVAVKKVKEKKSRSEAFKDYKVDEGNTYE